MVLCLHKYEKISTTKMSDFIDSWIEVKYKCIKCGKIKYERNYV